jgi:uncharacterized membrane protein
VTPPDHDQPTGGDDDDSGAVQDNSVGRLLTLSDGIFAIAMTLLTFDLKVPSIGSRPSESALRHALGQQTSNYLSVILSFYVIASYWRRHRLLMRSVVVSHPRLVGETLFLLFIVAVMPFPTRLLGEYGSNPFALAVYGGFNTAALLTLIQIRRSVEKYELLDHNADPLQDATQKRERVRSLAVFMLSIPAGYVIGRNGPWVLVLLAVPLRVPGLKALKRRRQLARAGA